MSRADAAAADDPDVTPETAALREDIEQTRTEMSGTIDAIQDRLDPEVLSEQAKDTAQEVADRTIPQAKDTAQEVADRTIPQAKEAVREVTDHAIAQTKEAVREVTAQAGAALRGATIGKVEDMARYAGDTAGGWRHTLVATVKAHPIPAALAGLTLGYLVLNRESGPPAWEPRRGGVPDAWAPGYRATGSGAAGVYGPGAYDARRDQPPAQPSLSERAGDLAGQAQETAGQVAGQVQETAGQVVDQVQEQAARAQGFLGRQLEESPLAVGAVAVALGAALGAAIGTTPTEDRYFGEARDRLMGRAGEATQETLEKVERVADEVTGTVARAAEEVTSTAQREARAQDLLPKDMGAAGAGAPGATGSRPSGSGSRPA